MIELIPDLPDNVLGFRGRGIITGQDYETVVYPAVDAYFSQHHSEGARVLYWLNEDFEGYEAAALWDDAMLGFKHPIGWKKIAVVSDTDWIKKISLMVEHVMLGHFRLFPTQAMDAAKHWVSE